MPLGEVKLTRKIKSLLILFRTNTNIEIWDQNRKRLFEYPKAEYALRSLYSLIKSIKYLLNKYSNIEVKLKIIDDKSNKENLSKIKDLAFKSNLNIEIINHDNKEHNEKRYDMLFGNAEKYLRSVIDEIKKLKLDDDSLILIMSDHGISVGE